MDFLAILGCDIDFKSESCRNQFR